MGITITSSASIPPVASSTAASQASSAAQPEDTAPTTSFAALLAQLSSGQILPQAPVLEETPLAGKPEEKATDEQAALDPLLLTDPSGMVPNGLPLPPAQATVAVATTETQDAISLLEGRSRKGGEPNTGLLNSNSSDETHSDGLVAISNALLPVQAEKTTIAPPSTEIRQSSISTKPDWLSANTDKAETIFKPAETANIAVESPPQPTSNSFSSTLSALTSTHAQQENHFAERSHSISTPLQNAAWGGAFGEKIVWLAKNEQQSAQISINPPQLGPMQISLSLNGDQASAVFTSAHAEVRQAIETAMPQLREMLSSAGITLGDTSVGAQLPQQQRETQQQFANGNRSTGENAILPADSGSDTLVGVMPIQRGRGLVDLFA